MCRKQRSVEIERQYCLVGHIARAGSSNSRRQLLPRSNTKTIASKHCIHHYLRFKTVGRFVRWSQNLQEVRNDDTAALLSDYCLTKLN